MRILVLLVASIALLPAIAQASSTFRCGDVLVSVGDSSAEVALRCGEPATRQTVALEPDAGSEELVEQWVYDPGPGRFLAILTFEAGRLASIEKGDRQ